MVCAWCLVLGGWCEGAEVEPRAAGREEGEVNGRVAVPPVAGNCDIIQALTKFKKY